ncbi:hypothetical protein AB1F87_002047 [Vibrio mimicus]
MIDEGLAVFVEEAAPMFSALDRAEAARGWLQRKVRHRTDTRNPFALMTQVLKRADALMSETQSYTASIDPVNDYFAVNTVARIAAEVPADMDDIEWLFEVARRLKALRLSPSRDGFAAAARGLTEMLEAKVMDPALGPDATITLMYLYRYLPDFAGGSVQEALRLSEEISTRYGKKEAASRLRRSLEEDNGIVS